MKAKVFLNGTWHGLCCFVHYVFRQQIQVDKCILWRSCEAFTLKQKEEEKQPDCIGAGWIIQADNWITNGQANA